MSNVRTIEVSVAVDVSQEEVFETVTDWGRQQEWIYFTEVRGVSHVSSRMAA